VRISSLKYTYVFAIYLGLNHDDLVEIKVQANSRGDAISKVKLILGEHVDIGVTGLVINDWYEN
jgi:hypothetical protein